MAVSLRQRFLRVYVVPGAVFQSVMVGGGYGTGREIVEYFTRFGFLGGLLAFAVTFVAIALVLMLSFELARRFRAYDYRNFMKHLLGRAWVVFEVLVVLDFVLVLAVLASAAGSISRDSLEIPYGLGLALMLGVIGLLTFFGRSLIEKALTFWSVFLYAVFIGLFVVVFRADAPAIQAQAAAAEVAPGWAVSGFQYAMYNVAGVPLLLYAARDIETRSQAMISGVLGSAIALVPAVIFHVAFFSAYPAVVAQDIPVYWLFDRYADSWLVVAYSVMLFGTFIETGAGLLQGINERVDAFRIEQGRAPLPRAVHAAVAVTAVLASAGLSLWGITNLIARGYGTMAWVFCAVYIMPLVSVGVWKVTRPGAGARAGEETMLQG